VCCRRNCRPSQILFTDYIISELYIARLLAPVFLKLSCTYRIVLDINQEDNNFDVATLSVVYHKVRLCLGGYGEVVWVHTLGAVFEN